MNSCRLNRGRCFVEAVGSENEAPIFAAAEPSAITKGTVTHLVVDGVRRSPRP